MGVKLLLDKKDETISYGSSGSDEKNIFFDGAGRLRSQDLPQETTNKNKFASVKPVRPVQEMLMVHPLSISQTVLLLSASRSELGFVFWAC